MDHDSMGMALGVSHYRRHWVRLAGFMAIVLSQARGAPTSFDRRIGLHTKRSSRAGWQSEMAQLDLISAGVGVRECEVSDRSHLVPLPVLDPGFPAAETCSGPDADRSADHGDLCHCRSGQRRWRLALVVAYKRREERQLCPEEHNALVRDQ